MVQYFLSYEKYPAQLRHIFPAVPNGNFIPASGRNVRQYNKAKILFWMKENGWILIEIQKNKDECKIKTPCHKWLVSPTFPLFLLHVISIVNSLSLYNETSLTPQQKLPWQPDPYLMKQWSHDGLLIWLWNQLRNWYSELVLGPNPELLWPVWSPRPCIRNKRGS